MTDAELEAELKKVRDELEQYEPFRRFLELSRQQFFTEMERKKEMDLHDPQ